MSEPAPQDSLGFVLSAAIACMGEDMKRQQEEAELAVRVQCSYQLARCVAPLMSMGEAELWNALTYVPDDLLHLLDTPDGWTALVGVVACDLGSVAPHYRPTVH